MATTQSFAGFPGSLLVFDLFSLELKQSGPQSWLSEGPQPLVTLSTLRPQPQYVVLPVTPAVLGKANKRCTVDFRIFYFYRGNKCKNTEFETQIQTTRESKNKISHILEKHFHINIRANGKLGSVLCHFCPTYGKQQKNVETLSKNELLSVLEFMVWQRRVIQNESFPSPSAPCYIFNASSFILSSHFSVTLSLSLFLVFIYL